MCLIHLLDKKRNSFSISTAMPLTRQNVVIHNDLGRELNREQGLLMTCQFSLASFIQVIDIEPILHPCFNRTAIITVEE